MGFEPSRHQKAALLAAPLGDGANPQHRPGKRNNQERQVHQEMPDSAAERILGEIRYESIGPNHRYAEEL
jgi:hypothetical protein